MEVKEVRKYFAIVIMIFLAGLLLYAIYPFISGIFGALIMYALFNPLYLSFLRRKINKNISALLTILVSIIVILIPLIILLMVVAGETAVLFRDPTIINNTIGLIDNHAVKISPYLSVSNVLKGNPDTGKFISSFFLNTLSGIGIFLINLVIMYFALYYLLIREKSIFETIEDIIPFNETNSKKLTKEFRNVTYTSVFVSGIIAVIQGGLITIAFLIFGIKGALFWGFVSAVLSFFPIIGPVIVWVPATVIQFINNNIKAGIGILIFGIVISTIDNFIRPYLQKKIGRIHPLITLIGIFIGVPLLGLIGIIAGPLIISYVILTLKMFKEEYIDK